MENFILSYQTTYWLGTNIATEILKTPATRTQTIPSCGCTGV